MPPLKLPGKVKLQAPALPVVGGVTLTVIEVELEGTRVAVQGHPLHVQAPAEAV